MYTSFLNFLLTVRLRHGEQECNNNPTASPVHSLLPVTSNALYFFLQAFLLSCSCSLSSSSPSPVQHTLFPCTRTVYTPARAPSPSLVVPCNVNSSLLTPGAVLDKCHCVSPAVNVLQSLNFNYIS